MSAFSRWFLYPAVLLCCFPLQLWSQNIEDVPARSPARTPRSRAELDQQEARILFGLGHVHERHNRLVEAVKAFERARELDPDSPAIGRALFPLYLALDRLPDALTTCEKVLHQDPGDVQTGFHYARQLRNLDRKKEAIEVLTRATTSQQLNERHDVAAQIWFDLAVLHEQAGDDERAEKCFREVVAILDKPATLLETGKFSRDEINTQAAETLERLGRLCLKCGKIPQAIEAFEKAKSKDSLRAPRLSYNLAQVQRDQKNYKNALQQVQHYLRSQPQSTDGYELRIDLQRKLGLDWQILPLLAADSARDPHNTAVKLLLAREYSRAGQLTEAEAIYSGVLSHDVSPEVYRGLFEVYKQQNRGVTKVLQILNKSLTSAVGKGEEAGSAADARRARAMLVVIREDADLVKTLLPLALEALGDSSLSVTTRGVLATLASRSKQLPTAERLYRSCLERAERTQESEHEVYLGLLRVLRMQHKHKDIVELCEKGLATAQQTNRVLFHTEQVRAYQMLDQHKEAVAASANAVADAGKKEMLMCKRIWIDALSQAGMHDKALTECQNLIREYNEGAGLRDARATLSSIYQNMGKFDEAQKQLALILAGDPNDATANNDLGYLLADRNKNLKEAEEMVRKAIELDRLQRGRGTSISVDGDQDNAAYIDSLGWVLFRQGKIDEACSQLEKASGLSGGEDDPVVWDHLGDAYFRKSQKAKAESAWKKALMLYNQGARRKSEGRVKEIQDKLRQFGSDQ